jgi:uncharacterized alkaline shock family protein YloU
MSIFNAPYIQDYELNDREILLKVYFMEKECGYINITNEKINSIISCGTKSFKGLMKRDEVYFEYNQGKFIIKNNATKKIILKMKCPMKIYEK